MRRMTELAKTAIVESKPALAFDCEGINLGRSDSTRYIQIHDLGTTSTYLADLLTLGQEA